MSGQDERKIKIELAIIQMRYMRKLATFLAVIFLEFSLFWVMHSYLCAVPSPWLLIATAGMAATVLFTIVHYLWELQEIERETQALKQKYMW